MYGCGVSGAGTPFDVRVLVLGGRGAGFEIRGGWFGVWGGGCGLGVWRSDGGARTISSFG